jgi:mannose/cellobiose epimerase-like protein (N-acyl-D-glucosamine 2-epimerase family)
LSSDGECLDETAMLYDQAFLLLALASAHAAGVGMDHARRAEALRDALVAEAPAEGGLVERGTHPFQSNAHMHLLEACLAWEEAGGDAGWARLADRIVALAHDRFIDTEQGCLREFFSPDWSPAPGEDGRRVEPGHQFEWAWLLARYARSRGDNAALVDARRLYGFGLRGIDPLRRVAVDALTDDGSVISARARLWPQTEWMKAALILAESAQGTERQQRLDEAAEAQRAVWRYLTPDGVWRDKLLEDGTFLDEPAPASSLYHLFGAWSQLAETARRLALPDADRITLA